MYWSFNLTLFTLLRFSSASASFLYTWVLVKFEDNISNQKD